MRKDNKFINKNYYISPFPDEHLAKLQKRNVALAIIATALLVAFFVLLIYPGFNYLIWIAGAYEANVAFILLFAVSFIGLGFCSVNNFFGYRMRREVKQKDAPTLGFKKMSYNGQFFAAVLVSALAVFVLVLFIGYHIADSTGHIDKIIADNGLTGKSGGFDGAGLASLIIVILSTAAAWIYYICAYNANKVMQYIRVDFTETEKSAEPSKVKQPKHRNLFSLTPDEVEEASNHEIASRDPDDEDN